MEFKDVIAGDRGIFLNIEEFGEIHQIRVQNQDYLIRGVLTSGIREKTSNEKKKNLGIFTKYINLYINNDELIKNRLHQGQLIYVDGLRYSIMSIEEQQGICALKLEGLHQ